MCSLSVFTIVQCSLSVLYVPPNPQDGRTLLMLAAQYGHLPMAKLLVETYHCNVNEENGEVSGCELMIERSEHSTCVCSTCDQVTQEVRIEEPQ